MYALYASVLRKAHSPLCELPQIPQPPAPEDKCPPEDNYPPPRMTPEFASPDANARTPLDSASFPACAARALLMRSLSEIASSCVTCSCHKILRVPHAPSLGIDDKNFDISCFSSGLQRSSVHLRIALSSLTRLSSSCAPLPLQSVENATSSFDSAVSTQTCSRGLKCSRRAVKSASPSRSGYPSPASSSAFDD